MIPAAPAANDPTRIAPEAGRVGATMAHDMNNLLTVVLAHAALLRLETDDAKREQHVAAMESAAEATAVLASDLGELLGGGSSLRVAPVDVGAVLAELAPFTQQLLGDRWTLELDAPAGVTSPVARSRLEFVVVQLALALRTRVSGGGRLSLRLAAAPPSGTDPKLELAAIATTRAPLSADGWSDTRLSLLQRAAERVRGRFECRTEGSEIRCRFEFLGGAGTHGG